MLILFYTTGRAPPPTHTHKATDIYLAHKFTVSLGAPLQRDEDAFLNLNGKFT